MKKTLIAILLTGLSLNAVAGQTGFVSPDGQGVSTGGFNGPSPGVSSAAQAKKLRDDAWVILEGNIIKRTGHELYEFRDSSGIVSVDIDDRLWVGQSASPQDSVRIEGEVDKDWNSVEIDVKNLRVMK